MIEYLALKISVIPCSRAAFSMVPSTGSGVSLPTTPASATKAADAGNDNPLTSERNAAAAAKEIGALTYNNHGSIHGKQLVRFTDRITLFQSDRVGDVPCRPQELLAH
jgi:hypothetical protein